MVNGIRTGDLHGFNKGRSLKFREGSRLKTAGGHINRNDVKIKIKMKTVVLKPLMINNIKLRLRNIDN